MFLRKIRSIRAIIASHDEKKKLHEFTLGRQDSRPKGLETTSLIGQDILPTKAKEQEVMVVFRQNVIDMPPELKRRGITESEVVLAFHKDDTMKSRPTFNFLPIRQYGFPVRQR